MDNKILVAYYSHSSNTRKIAEMIQVACNGDLLEILPETPYPADYNTVVAQAKKEIRAGYCPPLAMKPIDLAPYKAVFLGTPTWWSTMAPPVASFLKEQDLSQKIVAPFCTHGGGGAGHIQKDMAKLCPPIKEQRILSVYGNSGAQSEIEAWVQEIFAKLS